MTCQDLPIADYVDGELDGATEQAVMRHLETCEACRTLVADLRTVRAAAFTLERLEPPAELWPRIRMAAASEAERPSAWWAWPSTRAAGIAWAAAAAVLVLATSLSIITLVRGRSAMPDDAVVSGSTDAGLVDSVESDLRLAEAHYDKAIQGLEQIARGDSNELDPQIAAVIQKNLLVVDQAIDESRAALRTEPGSTTAQTGLFDAMRAKVALLQQTVELINEMRKGNQAEAGRLMQDLTR